MTSIRVPEWEVFMAPLTLLQTLRHFFFCGETGSGKTQSGILPLLRALLGYEARRNRDTRSSALVVDPKDGELIRFLGSLNVDGLVPMKPGEGNWKVPLFLPGPDGGIDTAHGLVDQIFALSPVQGASGTRNEGFWRGASRRLLSLLIGVDHWISMRKGTQVSIDSWAWRLADRERAERLWKSGAYMDLLAAFLAEMLNSGRSFMSQKWIDELEAIGVPEGLISELRGLGEMHAETLSSIVATVQNDVDALTARATRGHLWSNPFLAPSSSEVVDACALMDAGAVVVYSPPRPGHEATVLGRAIKRAFFDAALHHRDRRRPFLYVADEFQRFITSDPTSSEANFFDRCRAYGVTCVVATQSEAALRNALEGTGPESASATLEVILSNLANKFFFRTTDPQTQERLRKLLPGNPFNPGDPHVTELHPVTSLRPGQAYWMVASGEWGRGQVRLSEASVAEGVV